MRWNPFRTKMGQTEHLVSFGISAVLILIGIVVISLTHTDVYDGLQRRINEQLAHSSAERQLTTFLSTPASFEGRKAAMWELFGGGKARMKESRFSPGYLAPYDALERYAWTTFNPLYTAKSFTLWYLLVQYEDGTSMWIGNAESLESSCSKAYESYSLDAISLALPILDGTWMNVELHYCIPP